MWVMFFFEPGLNFELILRMRIVYSGARSLHTWRVRARTLICKPQGFDTGMFQQGHRTTYRFIRKMQC